MTAPAKVPFGGAELLVRRSADPETTLVAIEGMGLSWQSHQREIGVHPMLSTCATKFDDTGRRLGACPGNCDLAW